MVTIPIVPSLVYAALLTAMGVALRRRLRAAWWLLVLWWLVLPELARIVSLLDGGPLLQLVGLVLVAGVLVVAWRARHQFAARRVPGSLLPAIVSFLVGGAAVLLGGAAVVHRFGKADDFGTAALYVFNEMLSDVGWAPSSRRWEACSSPSSILGIDVRQYRRDHLGPGRLPGLDPDQRGGALHAGARRGDAEVPGP